MTDRISEWSLAQTCYREHGVDVARMVRMLRRHGFVQRLAEARAKSLLEWVKRDDRNMAFASITLPEPVPVTWQTGQSGPQAGPQMLTKEDIIRLLDQPLSNGTRVRDARRQDLLDHASVLEQQAGTMLHHARVVRLIAESLRDEVETVADSLSRQAVA